MEPFDERDKLLDEYQEQLDARLNSAFDRFIARLPDDPRAIALTILFLLLMEELESTIQSIPWAQHAQLAATLPPEDAPSGSTRGLDFAQQALVHAIESRVMALTALLASKAAEMAASGKTAGFIEEADKLSGKLVDGTEESISTALLMWERIVLDKIADLMGDDTVFMYAGPLDEKNRPFCRDIVSKPNAYSRRAIERLNSHPLLHNYVPPNVFTLCGGRNCRHVWLPISTTHATAQGLTVLS